jgi:separase
VGTRPSADQLTEALSSHEVFLYFGHGGGEQYIPLAALKQLHSCASSLLMGCSSGRLQQMGLYEPSGTIWAYLLAGKDCHGATSCLLPAFRSKFVLPLVQETSC